MKKYYLLTTILLCGFLAIPLVESAQTPSSGMHIIDSEFSIRHNQTEVNIHNFGYIYPFRLFDFSENLSEGVISLEVEVPFAIQGFWNAQVSPNEFKFQNDSSEAVFFDLIMDINKDVKYEVGHYKSYLNISVRRCYSNGTEENFINLIPFDISIAPFYSFIVKPANFTDCLNAGTSHTYNFTVQNLGLYTDELWIDIEDEEKLKKKGITFDFPKQMTLWDGETKSFNITIKVSENAIADDYRIKIIVQSAISMEDRYGLVEERITLNLRIKDESPTTHYGIYLGLALIIILILAGSIYIKRKGKDKSE